jgi:hypothetical protein
VHGKAVTQCLHTPRMDGLRALLPRPIRQEVEADAARYRQLLRQLFSAVGSLLVVVDLIDDALRILTQWPEQVWYLQKYVSAL